MLDEHASAQAIRAARPQIAVLGIGAIEQHGAHLPVGTDWIAADAIARRVAEQLEVLLVPAIPFSMSECHGAIARYGLAEASDARHCGA